jgi:Ca2+-binding EF-hand superfamily protein
VVYNKTSYTFNQTKSPLRSNYQPNISKSTFYESFRSSRYESPSHRINQKSVSPRKYQYPISPNRTMRIGSPLKVSGGLNQSKILSVDRTNRSFYGKQEDLSQSMRYTNKLTNLSAFGNSPNKTSRSNYFSQISLSLEEENFQSYLKTLFDLEGDIERARSELVLRSDFNVEDAFRIFELDGRGYLTDLDIKYGLNALDIFATTEEISLVIKRYDVRKEGVLTYANFFEMVSPVDREYRRMLENRTPNKFSSSYNKVDVFLTSTKLLLSNLFNILIKVETRLEGWRQRLNNLPRFNIRLIFDKIDRLGRNFIEDNDITSYLIRHDIKHLNRDVDYLFLRFDKDRDGRINYTEVSHKLYNI